MKCECGHELIQHKLVGRMTDNIKPELWTKVYHCKKCRCIDFKLNKEDK